MSFAVNVFAPIALRLLKVGPFQAKEVVIPFDDDHKTRPTPTNVYLIAAVNGLGKTTILEAIVTCMALLEGELRGPPPEAPEWLDDHPDARLQLDVLVELAEQGEARRGVLSLILCEESRQASPGLHYWTGPELRRWGADFNARLTVHRPSGPRVWDLLAFNADGDVDERAVELVQGLRDHIERAKKHPVGTKLMAPKVDAPAVLMFTSHRDLAPRVPSSARSITQPPEWAHSLVRRFDSEHAWLSSLDALLVYLDYIDGRRSPEFGEPRFNQARALLNKHLFVDDRGLPTKSLLGVDREQMATVVEVKTPNPDGGAPLTTTHGLDRLSSGEKAFAQILVRLATHMTQNTLVLIDEADLHLHPRWERGLMWTIKELAKDYAKGGKAPD
ncbi:ATP-binding protein, partial [Myxococcota bacterium]|nr:ATP-binding protein [Myxococcota bacterium]